jgi:hypothetical protein
MPNLGADTGGTEESGQAFKSRLVSRIGSLQT